LHLDLLGTGRVIEAAIRILTIEMGGISGRNNYTARITGIERGDYVRLETWLDERSRPLSKSGSRSRATGGGRQNLGSALKAGLDKGRGPATPPTAPTPKEPESLDELVLAPAVNLASDGSSISVAWANWTSVTASWEESLSEGTLRVYLDSRHPPRGYSLIVQLCLPDDKVHAVMGRVGISKGPTLYLDLTLKESARKALAGK
jgi:hypothetical protein